MPAPIKIQVEVAADGAVQGLKVITSGVGDAVKDMKVNLDGVARSSHGAGEGLKSLSDKLREHRSEEVQTARSAKFFANELQGLFGSGDFTKVLSGAVAGMAVGGGAMAALEEGVKTLIEVWRSGKEKAEQFRVELEKLEQAEIRQALGIGPRQAAVQDKINLIDKELAKIEEQRRARDNFAARERTSAAGLPQAAQAANTAVEGLMRKMATLTAERRRLTEELEEGNRRVAEATEGTKLGESAVKKLEEEMVVGKKRAEFASGTAAAVAAAEARGLEGEEKIIAEFNAQLMALSKEAEAIQLNTLSDTFQKRQNAIIAARDRELALYREREENKRLSAATEQSIEEARQRDQAREELTKGKEKISHDQVAAAVDTRQRIKMELDQELRDIEAYYAKIRSLANGDQGTINDANTQEVAAKVAARKKAGMQQWQQDMRTLQSLTQPLATSMGKMLFEGWDAGFQSIGDAFKNLIARMLAQLIESGILKLFAGLLGGGGGLGFLGGLFGFDVGTMAVPFDTAAVVHKGEIIIPPAQSADIRAGRAALMAGFDVASGLDVGTGNTNGGLSQPNADNGSVGAGQTVIQNINITAMDAEGVRQHIIQNSRAYREAFARLSRDGR